MDRTRSALVGVVVLVLLGAVARACPWSCPNGLVPRHNDAYNATTNGCGPTGLLVSTKWEFTPCCDTHDLCYQVCGESKKVCDDDFLECLNKVCKQVKKKKQQTECQQTAALFSLATTTFGCSSYQESQTAACLCDSRDEL